MMSLTLAPPHCQCADGTFVLKTESQTKPYGACVSIHPTPDQHAVKSVVVWRGGSGRAAALCICDGRDASHPRRPRLDAAYQRALEAAKGEDWGAASDILSAALTDPDNDWPEELLSAIEMALGE